MRKERTYLRPCDFLLSFKDNIIVFKDGLILTPSISFGTYANSLTIFGIVLSLATNIGFIISSAFDCNPSLYTTRVGIVLVKSKSSPKTATKSGSEKRNFSITTCKCTLFYSHSDWHTNYNLIKRTCDLVTKLGF